MMSSAILILLAVAAPQARSAAPVRQTATVEIRVTDRSGTPLKAAHVTVEGLSSREGTTTSLGRVTFAGLKPGTYMLRADRAGFIPLEKEFTIAAGPPVSVVAALSPAVRTYRSRGPVGDPRVVSIPDFVDKQLIGKESIKESAIGCSGASQTRLIQARELVAKHVHREADEMLYVVAGEGTLKVGDRWQTVTPGWFSLIPRGTEHLLVREGRNPIILLSLLTGQPCSQTVALATVAGR